MKQFIKQVFDQADNRDEAYTLLLYKVAETAKKSDRIQFINGLLKFLDEEAQNIQKTKIGNIVCPICGDGLDPELLQQYCDNCLDDQLNS